MKLVVTLLLLVCSAAAQAQPQGLPSQSLGNQPWDLGLFAGFATDTDSRYPTQFNFLMLGGRVGKVLTPQIGKGWARGNFEWALDLIPVYPVFHGDSTFGAHDGVTYGFGANPVVLKWNFTRGKKFAPFIELAGGFLITQRDFPESNTSSFNFVSGGGAGFHYFLKPKQAVTFTGKVFHLSNASCCANNPGINSGLQFTIGYNWFK
jgi:lipid A 3-O-deacylase